MFRRYAVTLGNDSDSYNFVYELESHRPAQEWAKIMVTADVKTLRDNFDPYQGVTRSTLERVRRLNELIHLLNDWLPEQDKITHCWDDKDPQDSLNKLHVHFPDQEKKLTDPVKLSQLTEYNDIIHSIEDILRNTKTKDLVWLLLLPSRETEINLNDDDYNHFRPNRFFGELCLHYPHIGRHPLELLKAKDYNCPIDQIVTQKTITSYHSLRFYSDYPFKYYDYFFKQFYLKSTINQLYNLNDPKLAFGYITLGKLQTVNDNYLSEQEILSVVKSTNKIIGWEVS